ncbi:MAG: 1-acyl-sn-glycerol-3-phosphate acyltransferase [Nitrospiraceae bacterium]|nr:MAG: 1-acyl-sn-glycerol-3-phosphate acyltransferase [Nitrospiraceae bacterium]
MNYIKIYFLNLYSYILFAIYSVVCIPALVLFVALMSLFTGRRGTLKLVRRSIGWWGRGITLIPFPFIRICCEDHSTTNVGGPYIFVCNHRSFSDGFLMAVLPVEGVQVVNIWPFRIPVIGFFARKAGYLNIRMMPSEEFFGNALELLREKVSIIFFPEGTRSGNRNIGNFHGSAFRLALKSKAPVVPLCISGSENIPPKGSLLLRPGTIRIRRLPAITWNEYKEMSVFTFKNRIREMIGRELALMERGV